MKTLIHPHTKRPLLVLLALLMLLFSCKKEDSLSTDEDQIVTVSLFLEDLDQQRDPLFAGDNTIHKLRIYVFNANGFIDEQKLFTESQSPFDNPFEMKVHAGVKKIVIVANEPAALTAQLNSVIRYSAIEPLLYPAVDGANPIEPPLTMTFVQNVTLHPVGTNTVNASLQRSVAKVTLDIKQETASADVIKITKVELKRNAKTATLLPLEAAPTSYWDWSKTYNLGLTNNADPQELITTAVPLYLYENIGSVADTAGRATQLMVEALYNGIVTRYYAYVNDVTSDANHHYALHRNHHYKLSGKITKLGEFSSLLLSTTVLPWNVEEHNQQFLKPEFVSILPAEATNQSAMHYATEANPYEIKVKIKGDVGAVWKATLSNGLEFGLDTSNGAVATGNADGTTEYTVRVRALKAPGDTPRQTALFFTVGGKKLVYTATSGNQLTDIIITQRAS